MVKQRENLFLFASFLFFSFYFRLVFILVISVLFFVSIYSLKFLDL